MSRKLFITVVLCFLCGAMYAQKDTLYLSDIYTTHIKYATEIKYVDISSTTNVVAKVVDNSKDVLAIRARSPFQGYSSVTVIEGNEAIHTYIVAYRESPEKLVIIEVPKVEEKKPAESYTMTMAEADRALSQKGVTSGAASAEYVREAAVSSGALTLAKAASLPRTLFHLSDESYGVRVSCDDVIIYKDVIFFVLTIENSSSVNYACSNASFCIEPKKTGKKSLYNDKNLFPRNTTGTLSCAPGKKSRAVYSFDAFSLLKTQQLCIYVNESSGQRELCIELDYKDINNARSWTD